MLSFVNLLVKPAKFPYIQHKEAETSELTTVQQTLEKH